MGLYVSTEWLYLHFYSNIPFNRYHTFQSLAQVALPLLSDTSLQVSHHVWKHFVNHVFSPSELRAPTLQHSHSPVMWRNLLSTSSSADGIGSNSTRLSNVLWFIWGCAVGLPEGSSIVVYCQWRTEGGLGGVRTSPLTLQKIFVGILITRNASRYSIFNQKY